MKKFLTVLLALSVVFTYSFSAVGTVFADSTTNENVATALGYVTSVHDSAKNLVSENGDQKYGTWEVSAANWALAYEDAYNALVDSVVKAENTSSVATVLNGATGLSLTGNETDRAVKLALEDYLAAASTGQTYQEAYASAALKAQLVEDAAAAHGKVNAIDTSIYSTTEYTKDTAKHTTTGVDYYWNKYFYVAGTTLSQGDAHYIARDVADSIVEGVNDGIDKVTAVDATLTGTAATIAAVNCHDALNSLMANHVALVGDTNGNSVEDADETWTYTFVSTIKILTTAEETADGASDAATIAAKKATIASNIAAFKATSTYLNASVNARAAYDEYLDAYFTAQTYLVENVANHRVSNVNVADTALVDNVKKAAETIEDAADLKTETNKDGSVKYDAETIDANLKTILTALYSGRTTRTNLTDGALITYVTTVEKVNTKATEKAKVDADAMEYNGTAYYALEWKAVEAALDTYYAAVDAAVVSSDIADAQTALTKAIAKIDTASTVLAYYASGKLNSTASSEFTKLKAYAAALIAEQGTTDPLVFDITDITSTMATNGADGTLVKYYIDKDARTAAEITALNSEVKALLASAKTASTLKAEAQNVVNMINALPAKANITASDKDAIEAAYNAYEDLNAGYKVYVTNYSTLKTAIETVMKAEKDVFLAATKSLPALANVTIADKAAVQAVADMIAAYNETEMYNINPKYSNTTVDALLTKVKTLEFDAVKAAVKAVPAADKVTAADKATIEAARTAYDALLADYGDELTSTQLADLKKYEKTIVEAEKALATALAEELAAQIKAVESLKIKTSTKLYSASKKIRVNWTVTGDTSAVTGYQVYKSKKAQSGYTFMGKTTKNYMDNKKGLKKGTRYYYKVRAYIDVDGERYYSDWSNKGNRIYK